MSVEMLEDSGPVRLPRWALLAGWLVCALALLPLFYAASWAGGEVGKFQMTTYEAATRQALKAKDFDAALKYCDGAIKAAHNRSDHWGRVFTLRAFAYIGQGNVQKAADELVLAGDFFTRKYYYLEDQDRRELPHAAEVVGKLLLQKKENSRALEVFSAGVMASGKPVDALEALAKALTPEERKGLWGDSEPYVLITPLLDAKENGPRALVNEQGRDVASAAIPNPEVPAPLRVAGVEVGPSKKDGQCWLSIPTCVALSPKPFGIRAQVKSPVAPEFLLGFWFEAPQKSATATQAAGPADADGWITYDVKRDLYRERNEAATAAGYSCEGGIINQVGIALPPGDATSIGVRPVQLYLPKA